LIRSTEPRSNAGGGSRGGGGRRLKADFAVWLAQARLECGDAARLDSFRLDRIRAAAAEFTARVRILSPRS
jgi:hypothetical protein